MSDKELANRVAELEQQLATLSETVRFQDILLDISIRTTDSALRGHIKTLVAALEDTSWMTSGTRPLAHAFLARMDEFLLRSGEGSD